MLIALISGFSLGFSLILAIGAQNAFVLRQGIRGEHVFGVCLTCAVSDAILILAGVAGADVFIRAYPSLVDWLRWGGAIFLFIYGARSLWRAVYSEDGLNAAGNGQTAFWPTILTCLVLTWANPHVYFDTVLLLGSVSAQFAPNAYTFGLGAVASSFVFFFGLGYGAGALRGFFEKPIAWRILDFFIFIVMWSIAAGLIIG